MLESALQAKLLKYCKSCGLLARAVAWRGRRGCPDVVIMGDGHCLWIELKRPDGKGRRSTWQRREHERMREHGITVYTEHRYDRLLEILEIEFPDHCG